MYNTDTGPAGPAGPGSGRTQRLDARPGQERPPEGQNPDVAGVNNAAVPDPRISLGGIRHGSLMGVSCAAAWSVPAPGRYAP